ncbi:MAG: hypothetical protein R3Y55_07060, partial [Rikenellaceae bacterium]
KLRFPYPKKSLVPAPALGAVPNVPIQYNPQQKTTFFPKTLTLSIFFGYLCVDFVPIEKMGTYF